MPSAFAHPGHGKPDTTVTFSLRGPGGTTGSRERGPLASGEYAVAIIDGATPARTDWSGRDADAGSDNGLCVA